MNFVSSCILHCTKKERAGVLLQLKQLGLEFFVATDVEVLHFAQDEVGAGS